MNKVSLFVATVVLCISVGIKVSASPQSEFYPPWWLNPGGNGSTVNGSLPFQNFPQGDGPPIRWFWRKWISSILRREESQLGNFTNGNSSIINDHRRHGGWWKSFFPWFNQRNGSNLSLPFENFPEGERPPIPPPLWWIWRNWASSIFDGRKMQPGSFTNGNWSRFISPWLIPRNGSFGNGSIPFGNWEGGEGPPIWWIWRRRISLIWDRPDFQPGNFTNGNWSRFIPPWFRLRNGSLPFGMWKGGEGPPMWWNRRNWFSLIFGRPGNFTNGNWSSFIPPWIKPRNGTFGNGSLPFGGEEPPMFSIWRNWISSILSREGKQPGSDVDGNHHRGWWRYILPWNGYGDWNNGNHTNGKWTYSPPGFVRLWRQWVSEMGNKTEPSKTAP